MNERITKIVIDTLGKEGVVNSRAFGHWALSDEELEKFAELIVRECARFMETNTKVNDDGEVVDAPHAWQMIDQFGTKCLIFGIEE
jgi:hypothetical protein